MNRGFKVLTTVLIIVIGILAVSSGFLYAKTTLLEKKLSGGADEQNSSDTLVNKTPIKTDILSDDNAIKTSPSVTPSLTVSVSPKPTTSTKVTPSSTLKPGTAGTYTVASGDTMYSIALKLKINWLDLAKANGLDETTANKIKIGQVLLLP